MKKLVSQNQAEDPADPQSPRCHNCDASSQYCSHTELLSYLGMMTEGFSLVGHLDRVSI